MVSEFLLPLKKHGKLEIDKQISLATTLLLLFQNTRVYKISLQHAFRVVLSKHVHGHASCIITGQLTHRENLRHRGRT